MRYVRRHTQASFYISDLNPLLLRLGGPGAGAGAAARDAMY